MMKLTKEGANKEVKAARHQVSKCAKSHVFSCPNLAKVKRDVGAVVSVRGLFQVFPASLFSSSLPPICRLPQWTMIKISFPYQICVVVLLDIVYVKKARPPLHGRLLVAT